MKCIELYPTKVFSKCVLNPSYNEFLIKLTYDLMSKHRSDDVASIRHGWQSSYDLHNLSEFRPLSDCVLDHATKYPLKGREIRPYITSMWLNVHESYGFNHVHVHSGAWYSGVYYIQCPPDSGGLMFLDPRVGAENSFYHKQVESDNYSLTPAVGDLILFPGWLPHAVEPNGSKHDRISVAFNIELDI
jgi:uncharacterized protein (TIGR02466 family)